MSTVSILIALTISSSFSDMPKFLKPASTKVPNNGHLQEIQGDNDYSKTVHYIDLIQAVKYAYIVPSTYRFSVCYIGVAWGGIEKFRKEQASLSAKCVTPYSLKCVRSFLKCSTDFGQMSTANTLLILSAKLSSWVLISQIVAIVLAVPRRGGYLTKQYGSFWTPTSYVTNQSFVASEYNWG